MLLFLSAVPAFSFPGFPNPEITFDESQAPTLFARRKSSALLPAGKTCADLERAFFASRHGKPATDLEAAWGPWSSNDRESVADCEKSPCDVKLDASEGQALGQTPEKERFSAFLKLVALRAEQYRREGKPRDYEFPSAQHGALTEPFAEFAKRLGRPLPAAPPMASRDALPLEARRITAGGSSAPGASSGKNVRQIIERREINTPSAKEVWIRAVYIDHYFDAWGEWASFTCDAAKGWQLDSAMLLEVDLMKSDSFLSRLGRGKMKSSARDIMYEEMSRWAGEVR